MTKQKEQHVQVTSLQATGLSFSAEAGLGLPIITQGYSVGGNRYLPYSSNSRRYPTANTYPQMLAKLAMESPTHSAALNIKAMLTTGLGFDKSELSRNVKKTLSTMNKKNQTIDDILEQVAQDYVTFSGFALKVSWTTGGKIYSVERIHFSEVRAGEPDENGDINYYVISNNWDNLMPTRLQKTYSLPVFNPKVFAEGVSIQRGVPALNDEQIANAEQIIYFYKELNSPAANGMSFYPVPDYVAGIDCILQEMDINISNKSLINNGLGGKTVINVPAIGLDEEKKAEYLRQTVKHFTGAANSGGLIMNFGEDVERMPTYTTLPALDADTYLNVQDRVVQTIVTVHNIPGILLNLRNGGAWSNTADEMEQAYQIFNRTKIAKYQQDIERVFNTIIEYMGYDVEMQIIPFSINSPSDVISNEVDKSEQVSSDNVETTSLDSK
jgi:hypothetical protein